MGWLTDWRKDVDIGLRPRNIFEGREVNVYPFTKPGLEWLEQNAEKFVEPRWSARHRCLELSEVDSLRLASILDSIVGKGLKVRFYGRLKGWDGKSSTLLHLTPENRSHQLRDEKRLQLEGARIVLTPLFLAAAIIAFLVCFWWLELGFLLSTLAAALAYPLMLFGIAYPVGYFLGKRAARRFKQREHNKL